MPNTLEYHVYWEINAYGNATLVSQTCMYTYSWHFPVYVYTQASHFNLSTRSLHCNAACNSRYVTNFVLTTCIADYLTRAWPGSQPNAIDRGGGGRITPPQANSQTNDRSETGEAALERSRRDGSIALLNFFLKGHVSGQGQVKGKNWAFQHFGS